MDGAAEKNFPDETPPEAPTRGPERSENYSELLDASLPPKEEGYHVDRPRSFPDRTHARSCLGWFDDERESHAGEPFTFTV